MKKGNELIESHKLAYHPEWVSRWKNSKDDWEKAKSVYPIYVEISPSGFCNHRCVFCAFDYVGYKPVFLRETLVRTLFKMAYKGVKSIMYAGEGEPTLHPELADIIRLTKQRLGIDVALVTNGSKMDERFLQKSLEHICWIKVSIDAGCKESYLEIHNPKDRKDWENVFQNLRYAASLKKEKKYECRIGAQMILLPETIHGDKINPGNADEVVTLALQLKETGIDYFVVKPYSHNSNSNKKKFENAIYYEDYGRLEYELSEIACETFDIIFRSKTIKKHSAKKSYGLCSATPFLWAHIMADGSVYSCQNYLLNEDFLLGNINEQPFEEIWEGERRRKHWEFMKNFNPNFCRKNCRMDEINRYLWEISHPPYNVSFP